MESLFVTPSVRELRCGGINHGDRRRYRGARGARHYLELRFQGQRLTFKLQRDAAIDIDLQIANLRNPFGGTLELFRALDRGPDFLGCAIWEYHQCLLFALRTRSVDARRLG